MGLRLKLVLLVLFFVLVSWCLHLISCLFEFAETLEKVEFSDLVLVLKTTWHFLLAAFLDFFVTLSVFPSLFGLTVRSYLRKVLNFGFEFELDVACTSKEESDMFPSAWKMNTQLGQNIFF